MSRGVAAFAGKGEPISAAELVRRQQASMLRWLLVGILVLTSATLAIASLTVGVELRTVWPTLLVLAALVLALFVLRRGHFRSAVALSAGAMLARLSAIFLERGVMGEEIYLLSLVIPITLVGMVLGRAALILVTLYSIGLVVVVLQLEASGIPFADASGQGPTELAIVYSFLILLFAFFLDRFGLSFRDALRVTAVREQELRDANARLQQEIAERRQAEAQLRLALDAVNMGIWTWNPARDEVYWSDTAKRLAGYERDEIITSERFYERVHPDDRPAIEARVARMVETRQAMDFEYRTILDDGSVRWFAGRGSVITNEAGEVERVLGVMYDISERKAVEVERARLLASEQAARAEAEASNARLSFLSDASHLLATSLEIETTLQQVAQLAVPQLADWCGIDLLAAGGETRHVAVAHSDPERVRWAKELQRSYPAETVPKEPVFVPEVTDEMVQQGARDERHLELMRSVGFRSVVTMPLVVRGEVLGSLTLVQAESKRTFGEDDLKLAEELAQRAAVAIDNARLFGQAQELNRTLESRVEERTRQLRETNSELESFSYSVSHDLRAPLRGIDGFSRILLEEYGDRLDEVAKGYVERTIAAAERMGEVIDVLLEFSRVTRSSLKLEPVDLSAIAATAVRRLQEAHPDRQVEVAVEDGLCAVGDRFLLTIALENLLSNAWKFSGANAVAHIAFGRMQQGGEEIYFVRDDGSGFNMQFAAKLFQPFQRLHDPGEFEGTGIGLATVQRIVQRHGGRIWAEGEPGKGATFYFTLARPKEANA